MPDRRVTVVGAGAMGAGIAQACAARGVEVVLNDVSSEALRRALSRLEDDLRRRAGEKAVPDIMGRIRAEADLPNAVQDADLVIEAVYEDLDIKRSLFAAMDAAADPDTLLATNTSSFRVAQVAEAVRRPERVLGLHFFFPAAANRLVEVVGADETEPGALDVAEQMMDAIGKVPIRTADAHGFCINRFLLATGAEAFRIAEEGIAAPNAIEAVAKEVFHAPFGPFGVYNLSGPVVTTHALSTLHDAFGPFYEPTPTVLAHAEEGRRFDLDDGADRPRADPDDARTEVAARLRGACFGTVSHIVDDGIATEEAVDTGARVGLRWQRGPFALMDSLGPSVGDSVRALHDRWGDGFPLPTRFA